MFDSLLERIQIPDGYAQDVDSYTDLLLESPDIADRVLLWNESPVVILPCYYPVWPEERAPLFKYSYVSDIPTDLSSIRTVLEQAETYLSPRDETLFIYGIRFGNVQLVSNTPGRFLADIEKLDAYRERLTEDTDVTVPRGVSSRSAAASGLWPTEDGWLYVEGKAFGADYVHWTVGLLRMYDPWDTAPIEAFYESITDRPPGRDSFWPLRAVRATASTLGPPVPFSESLAGRFTDVFGDTSAFRLAPNPLYNRAETVYGSESPLGHSDAGHHLAAPLFELPMLVYRNENTSWIPDAEYSAQSITAVSPPNQNTLFVMATLKRGRAY
ncbi:hypothetical protein [Salinirubrum litoreum]|uniref:Beta protein n=1 Tax=Salinirubrum litoreum TaxID=1126234 RepID=A0ABD5RFT7_9EURY|nr:hypothetical protein [Salinirubrum litoreum]